MLGEPTCILRIKAEWCAVKHSVDLTPHTRTLGTAGKYNQPCHIVESLWQAHTMVVLLFPIISFISLYFFSYRPRGWSCSVSPYIFIYIYAPDDRRVGPDTSFLSTKHIIICVAHYTFRIHIYLLSLYLYLYIHI